MRMLRPWKVKWLLQYHSDSDNKDDLTRSGTKHLHNFSSCSHNILQDTRGGDRVLSQTQVFWCKCRASSAPQHPLSRDPSPPLTSGHPDTGRALSWGERGRPSALAGRSLALHWESSESQGSLAKDETWRWVPVKQQNHRYSRPL